MFALTRLKQFGYVATMLAPRSRRPSPALARPFVPTLESLESRVVPAASGASPMPQSPPPLDTSLQSLYVPSTIFHNGQVAAAWAQYSLGGSDPLTRAAVDYALLGVASALQAGAFYVAQDGLGLIGTGEPENIALGVAGLYIVYFLGVTDAGVQYSSATDLYQQISPFLGKAVDAIRSLLGPKGPSPSPGVSPVTPQTGGAYGGGGAF